VPRPAVHLLLLHEGAGQHHAVIPDGPHQLEGLLGPSPLLDLAIAQKVRRQHRHVLAGEAVTVHVVFQRADRAAAALGVEDLVADAQRRQVLLRACERLACGLDRAGGDRAIAATLDQVGAAAGQRHEAVVYRHQGVNEVHFVGVDRGADRIVVLDRVVHVEVGELPDRAGVEA